MMKVILIQVWIGPIPDYFWFHYETTKNNPYLDFLFITDQEINLDAQNYKILNYTLSEIENLVFQKSNLKVTIKNNKKICDLKASYGHLFEEFTEGYDYFGVYDIDTLFGDVYKFLNEHIGKYDVISIAEEKYHNRIAGPFFIVRNTDELKKLYINNDFLNCFNSEHVECYEENVLNTLINNRFTKKLIYSTNIDTNNGGKQIYDCVWSGGKNLVKKEEKLIYHFFRKKTTKLLKVGNTIFANYNKTYVTDFYWVVSFTKNYENNFVNLLDSIKKYSNRKCIIYSINYHYQLPENEISNEQFIVRYINIPEGDKDIRNRDINIITSKPLINLDVLSFLPNEKFVCIDADIYFTVNSDDVGKHFERLSNYPLINSHIHDIIYLSGINPNEEWTSSLHVLANEMGVENLVIPRRKTNVVLFDKKSEWFFIEQMEIYEKYKNTKPGILALHDEDTANVILSKYSYTECLPMVDIEEVNNLDIQKFHHYSYNMTPISDAVVLPKNINEILFFHGIKSQDHYNKIKEEYDSSVIDIEEFYLSYVNNTLLFEKNSFLDNKTYKDEVNFLICDLSEKEVFKLTNQQIKRFFLFYISEIVLQKGTYIVKIEDVHDNKIIFKDLIEVK